MGSRIQLASDEGLGSRFYFTIEAELDPMEMPSEPQVSTVETDDVPSSANSKNKGCSRR